MMKPEKLTIAEKAWSKVGWLVAHHSWKVILVALLVVAGCGSGFARLEAESRPEKQWVPSGAPALEQKEYVDGTWSSTTRFNFFVAKCRQANCNILDPEYLQRLREKHLAVLDVVVDGDELKKERKYKAVDEALWAEHYSGNWSFNERRDINAKAKCFQAGPFCLERTVLDIFRQDDAIINNLTKAQVKQAINFWESQTQSCPVTIARADSPCVDASAWESQAHPLACQRYKTAQERSQCRSASNKYCDAVCPTACFVPPNAPPDFQCVPLAIGSCADNGCLTLRGFNNLQSSGNATGGGGAPDSAFAFEPFELKSVASSGEKGGGPSKDSNGQYESAAAVFSLYALADNRQTFGGGDSDPISEEWERKALCVLGVDTKNKGQSSEDCPADDLIEFSPNFQRSLGDEFGNAIVGDLAAVGVSYVVILVYLVINLSRFDTVHSNFFMSIITLVIVGASYAACMGLGAYFGLFNNQLTGNIPFLLLGLGVDDAFVLTSEFYRAAHMNPHNSPEDNIIITARYGGMSILITSATDALAFLVGSITRLPALSWFCAFAGLGVIFCFLLQVFFFLPFLAINARRAAANRYDMLCCFKSKVAHPISEESGCCLCLRCKSGKTSSMLRRVGLLITSKIGAAVTLLVFAGVLAMGVVGSVKIYKDFKLEWFFPDDSYVNVFFQDNADYFASGTPVTVYVRDIDYFKAQSELQDLHTYINTSKYVDKSESIENWYHDFVEASLDSDNATIKADLTASGIFGTRKVFYDALHEWYSDGGGARYRNDITWMDSNCGNSTRIAPSSSSRGWDVSCNPSLGINASRMRCTLGLEWTNLGQDRYNTMTALRSGVAKTMETVAPNSAFPYSFEFLYWEEVGIIDMELLQNLLICGGVIIVTVGIMIPHPRIAIWVIASIILSVVDLVGFMYWWGVTISGVSTIYILISVGLAVDYSAHIAHIFVVSYGSSAERSVAALERIGPSVFNAVVSTMLAVIVLSFSKSYVFRIFFKSLFLTVTLGGSHGLIFLPAVLSLFGGSKRPEVAETTEHVEVTSQANDEDEKLGKGGGKGHGPVTVSDDV
jgi:predicted RND superfamily exporter protein